MESKLSITGTQPPKPRTDQDRIMFQNQSHLIMNYFANSNTCPDLIDVCRATDMMVEYIKFPKDQSVVDRFDKFKAYIKEKYKIVML
jgi:hypothetical protein